MSQFIKKLPAVYHTNPEKKFFAATFDQVFSKKDCDLLSGYIGRRTPPVCDPVNDFYIPESTKNRTWWQLEPTAYSRNANTTKTNILFYDDLLNRINYYGGNTLNQDRLFESNYYSWAPPIDYDMFVNYHNYYWLPDGLTAIEITGISDTDVATYILGKSSFNTSSIIGATPTDLEFTTGLTVKFMGSALYPDPVIVENFGGCTGIGLVDGYVNIDAKTPDYIIIERGSADANAWSTSNRWYHKDTITQTTSIDNIEFPVGASRALRPIIQFIADLELYNPPVNFKSNIKYGFRDNARGLPLTLSSIQNVQLSVINSSYNINIVHGDLVCFFNDTTETCINYFPWDTEFFDSSAYDAGLIFKINTFIYYANVLPNGSVYFTPQPTPIVDRDSVIPSNTAPYNGAVQGSLWYFDVDHWVNMPNVKVSVNQAPLFQLYDHNSIPLDDAITYPLSTFAGNKVFSYKINTTPGAAVDPVLKLPLSYTSLGQSSDIQFCNNLITDRYVYGSAELSINGYYYYNTSATTPVYENNWNLYAPCPCPNNLPSGNCLTTSKQRVIDRYVVGYGTQYQFKLSVIPYGYPTTPDLVVSVNEVEVKSAAEQISGYTFVIINDKLYVDLEVYISTLPAAKVAPVVEIATYSHNNLNPALGGYFEIPQQLEANPTQLEVTDISASNLIEHFSSIIQNQSGFLGTAFGGDNNYKDTSKNRSLGSFILQNVAPTLKTMLVSSSNDLDVIASIRFSQDEYTKFKNKYLRTALQLINREFSPVQYHNNTVIISAWVDEILKTVNVSKEFSNAFAYSYMIANGSAFASEVHTVPAGGLITLTNYIDLSDLRNALYIYDVTGQETLLVIGEDYEIVSTNLSIDIQFNTSLVGNLVNIAFYKNPLPAYIPSTPTKIGTYGACIPRIELDTTYSIPTNVIIGHDGSKTIVYGDYRDQLLLELEKRIYNLLQYKYRNQYYLPLRIEDVKSGYFRQTRYSHNEFLEITASYLNKWSAKNRANYRANDWSTASADLPLNSPELWKLYNYATAVTPLGAPLNLPGNWKGIFLYYYDTIQPNTRPWEMLGFSIQPSWWVSQYGPGVITLAGQTAWPNTLTYSLMWSDIEAGIIRQGPSAIYDPITLLPQFQEKWARPGLSTFMPVDAFGEIIPVPTIFNVALSGNPYSPFDGFDNNWEYGDGSPVEQAWMSTSEYAFSVQEFLYLMKPGPFGELLWDTLGTQMSQGTISISGIDGPVMSSVNGQYVQNEIYPSSDSMIAWMRPKNTSQYVHAELNGNTTQIRFGYQRWVSDRILFHGMNITDTFGQKIRSLDVNLANKFGGFTNKDTTSVYLESVSTSATTTSLLIPTNNFSVLLHTGQPTKTYTYSGVIVRALSDGTFIVYGYDLLNAAFTVLDRSESQLINVEVGGTPAEFQQYSPGETYNVGDIVRYNGVYYVSLGVHTSNKFEIKNWQKLKALPVIGGIAVTYKPVSEVTSTVVPYGTILKSAQAVFDLLIGWGAYLELQGWEFTEVSEATNQLSDWLYSAKQFLFWLNTNWAPDASIQLSPAANNATLVVNTGYPSDVETISNGVYSILDKYGTAIAPNNTTTLRDGRLITVSPTDLSAGGIYFLQVNTTETEHILMFDNSTSFSDVIYDPLLRSRQQRLRFNGFRSNGWYGKMEAPGYLVMGNQLVPNYDTIVDAMRYYYDPDVTIDNPSLEDLGRHLIGYESKSYLDNMQVSNDTQYLFYQGVIRQKGTVQSFDKLFRSTKVQFEDTVEIYEEWALKLGDFGNTIEQVSTEFILKLEQNIGEVIVARMNFIPSNIGGVKQIIIVNAQNVYKKVPRIVISAPNADPSSSAVVKPLRQAKAYAILNSAGVISRIDITDPGYGYLGAPYVKIDSGSESNALDILYSVWQGDITRDTSLDNIIEIDIDDTNAWVSRPSDPQYTLEFPTTDRVEYSMPNSGYANLDDITWTSFDVAQTVVKWGTDMLNPVESDTVLVAKTFTEDWGIYKLVNAFNNWKVVKDAADNLLLLLGDGARLVPQMSTQIGEITDFGNLICLQIKDNNVVDPTTNYAVSFVDDGEYVDPETLVLYNSYKLLTLNGVPITSTDIASYNLFTELLVFKTMRWYAPSLTPLPTYVTNNDIVWFDNFNNTGKWAAVKILAITAPYWDILAWDFNNIAIHSGYQPASLLYGWDASSILYFMPYRMQSSMIDTSLFESAEVYQSITETKLVRLPIYDPFKGILPALAKQNISYIMMQDPARYNITGDTRLFTNNITFGESQVGKLWWDLSQARYVYYEQPLALDGSETNTENLVYRRNHWGQLFPGSQISIYEWTKSPNPPSEYTGSGIPRNVTNYVQIITTNKVTNLAESTYYFWVLLPTSQPNIENRTMSAFTVARLLASPKSQGFTYFAPLQQTAINNSYMFYNVQEILAYYGNNIQVKYRSAERNDQKHTQWMFFREGDSNSKVTPQYWDKLVDSICGYTKAITSYDFVHDDIVPTIVPEPTVRSYATMMNIRYGDDPCQFVNAYIPSGDVRGVVLRIHGGGWSSGNVAPWPSTTTEEASLIPVVTTGYALIDVNYRGINISAGATGNGIYPNNVNDITTVLQYCTVANIGATSSDDLRWNSIYNLIEQNGFVVSGTSAGGHLAIMGVGTYGTSSHIWPKAVESVAGPLNIDYTSIFIDNLVVQAVISPYVSVGNLQAASPHYQYGTSAIPGPWFSAINNSTCKFVFVQNTNDSLVTNAMSTDTILNFSQYNPNNTVVSFVTQGPPSGAFPGLTNVTFLGNTPDTTTATLPISGNTLGDAWMANGQYWVYNNGTYPGDAVNPASINGFTRWFDHNYTGTETDYIISLCNQYFTDTTVALPVPDPILSATEQYGIEHKIYFPVPDPTLSEAEKYGIKYRPRQGMFVDIYSARKVFTQAVNNITKHITIRDNNPNWNSDVLTDNYWDYTTWYATGFENVTPTVVFSTLLAANIELVAGKLATGAIVEVMNGTTDGRFVLYNVVQSDPNSSVQTFVKVGVEASAVMLLPTVYTDKNIYGLSIELRQLMHAFRTKVLINEYLVGQNELYFSMLNYVLSEQRHPDWVFKSSYIYINESNASLSKQVLYKPDQIGNIIEYITDVKPYHTKIREFTSTHDSIDVAIGTALDSMKSKTIITFGPKEVEPAPGINGLDSTDGAFISWDALGGFDILPYDITTQQQYVSGNPVPANYNPGAGQWPGFNPGPGNPDPSTITVELTFYDVSKIGYSQLFPYTFDFNSINISNPQSFITPENVVAIQVGSNYLHYGQHYYVEYNNDETYTAYLYENPVTTPIAYVLWDGGNLQSMSFDSYRNELAIGMPIHNFTVNVDTKLPVNDVSALALVPPATVAPYDNWGGTWDEIADPVIANALVNAGGTANIPWDAPLTLIVLDDTISYKENLSVQHGDNYYRNADKYAGELLNVLPAPETITLNIDVITVYVDPLTHMVTDILPEPGAIPGTIWINGEQIEYRHKALIAPNTWELRLVYRGINGTAPTMHDIASKVWVSDVNIIPDSSDKVWSLIDATNPTPDLTTQTEPGKYTSINGVAIGGLWYAGTPQAEFLKSEPGTSVI